MLDELADLLLGSRCPGCGAPGLGLCGPCGRLLDGPAMPVDDARNLGELPSWCTCRYPDQVRELLSAHKDRGAWWLARPLGRAVATSAWAALDHAGAAGGELLLVPVPSSRRAVCQRGYDHGRALARVAARELRAAGVQVRWAAPLRRTARVRDQSGLGRVMRARNQRGSMTASRPTGVTRVVLVDDICTTGATLAEAARAMSEVGWSVLGGAVVAHPTRPGNLGGKP